MTTYLFLALFACKNSNFDPGFSTNSSTSSNELGSNSGENDGTSSGGSGTDETASSGDLAAADNEDAPQISNMAAYFAELEGLGDVIEIHVFYEDAQDDLEGGTMSFAYSNGNESGLEELSLATTSSDAFLEDGEVTIYLQAVDTTLNYDFLVRLTDSSGNKSNEYAATATAID
ncbi:MAG: hypothetical protein VX278_11725 [Myxococcota bacterium]|nr:hypothetical protein [Myxococcota bacterium]